MITYLFNEEKIIDITGTWDGKYLITKFPADVTKSNNGGDYHEGYYVLSPAEAFERGIIDGDEAKELEKDKRVLLIFNHLLFSDFAEQGREIVGFVKENEAKRVGFL